ncbi:MAG: leucine-rich repeat protein [Clostridia bacterium]|nr:leucine-rich repeat protein [Clostridia bacterium]
MKKALLFCSILITILLCCTSVFAVEIDDSNLWEFQPYSTGVEVTAYKGTQTDVYVPSKLTKGDTEYSVIKLGNELFKGNTALNSVTLGEGITEIGASAFEDATNLVCIVTNESLTTIGGKAFSGCTNFNSIILYDTVTSIGENAFAGCGKLTIYCNETTASYTYATENNISFKILNSNAEPEIITLNGVEYYIQNGYAYATSFNGSLTDLVIPSNINGYPVKDINNVFKESNIKSIVLPETILSIKDSAFYNCINLKSITIPNSIKAIGNSAFYNCDGLTSITIPDGVEEIGDKAFETCSNLETVIVGKGVNVIGSSAFGYCYKITSITLAEGLETIKGKAFYDCEGFIKIKIPSSVTTMYTTSFSSNIVLMVDHNSYAHTFAVNNNCLHFVVIDGAEPEFYTVEGVTYFIKDAEAVVLSYDGVVKSLIIPSSVGGYPVTDIRSVFAYTSITSIVLPETIKIIKSSAFAYCSHLTTITISEGISAIGYRAFYWCGSLKSIAIPDSVTEIGEYAFYECDSLESVTTGNGVITICDYAFAYCSGLRNLTLGNNVTTICEYAFYRCTALRDLVIPQNVKTIEKCAFHSCGSITELVIPANVTSVGQSAFSYCNGLVKVSLLGKITMPLRMFSSCAKLTEIFFSDNITTIGELAFELCTSLKTITIPDTITIISKGAFQGCTNLESVVLPSKLKSISNWAFEGCTNLINVTIPSSVTSIGSVAFRGCLRLAQLKIPSTVKYIDSDAIPSTVMLLVYENSYAHTFAVNNNYLYFIVAEGADPELYTIDGVTYYIKDNSAIVLSYNNSVTDLTILPSVQGYPVTDIGVVFRESAIVSITLPETITEIKRLAFSDCTSLTTISIPNSVTRIGNSAFDGCSSLSNINIPNSVTKIEPYAFRDCDSLIKVIIPDSVTEIGYCAFEWCDNLISITFPDSVTSLGTSVLYNCTKLKNVTLPSNMTAIPASMFHACRSLVNITIPENVRTIGDYAFSSCENLAELNLPDNVETIGTNAFHYCRRLENLVIPDSVVYIGPDAFGYCSSISSIEIGAGLSTISSSTFVNCNSLRKLTIPGNVKVIGDNAFAPCTQLNKLVMCEGVTTIGNEAFKNCSMLSNFTIPASVTSIGERAFMGCSNLTEIIIPDSIANIKNQTFAGCTGIRRVVLPDNLQSISPYAFASSAKVSKIRIPSSVLSLSYNSFPSTTIWIVEKDSYAHTFATENNLLYFIIHKTENPEISFGKGITGTVKNTKGEAVAGATIEILYDDGTLKESVVADNNGNYTFTYAEVGRYTIRATDSNGNTASEIVSVKRMNVFDVYIAGETDLILKQSYSVSGTVFPELAKITLSDTMGNIIKTIETTDGTFTFTDIPRGSYIVKAENGNGSTTTEIYVSNEDVSGIILEIKAQSATISGDTKIENRDGSFTAKVWIKIDLIDANGNVVAHTTTDEEGRYTFNNVPAGSYNIVATTNEMRPDIIGGFDKSHELKGYGHIEIVEFTEYIIDTIVLREDKINITSVSGKVTANGSTQDCQVILTNENGDQVAVFVTDNNGKYNFINIPDGMYCITAITKVDGMGFTVITIKDGAVHGNTDIKVAKADKISKREATLLSIPDCNTKAEAILYIEAIHSEKAFYDSLSDKERKQLSEEWIEKLFKLVALVTNSTIETTEGVTVENLESVISTDEIEETVEFTLTVTETSPSNAGEDGINSEEEYETEKIKDKKGKNKNIAKYYDITFTKDGENISNIQKQTETNGKLRITMEIPEEYRGHTHYSFIHMHKGEAVTLVDLDDDPNTVTFEIDKFSTFALAYSDTELVGEVEQVIYPASISYNDKTGKISVSSTVAGTLYVATYNDMQLVSLSKYPIPVGLSEEICELSSNQAAFVWNSDQEPLCKKFTLGN